MKLVPPDQLHITVAFLGRISPPAREIVLEVYHAVASTFTPFTVYPHGLGAFPRLARPKVIWVGLEGDTGQLIQLISHTERELAQAGILPIRGAGPLIPHITIARVKRKKRSYQLNPIREVLGSTEIDFHDLPITARSITLYQSHLSRQGPKHTPVETIPLGATRSSSSTAGRPGSSPPGAL